jgi:exodeoxyribonuclease-5
MTEINHTKIHAALSLLAGVCDYARQKDDAGFNAGHTSRGHELAAKVSLTDDEATEGLNIIRHYRRQLGDEVLNDVLNSILAEEFNEDSSHLVNNPTPSPSVPPPPSPFTTSSTTPVAVETRPVDDSTTPQVLSKIPPVGVPGLMGYQESKKADLTPETTSSSTSSISLTEEQESAVTRIIKWSSDPLSSQEFKLGGYAGTGKTTVIKVIKSRLEELRRHVTICAFTGKAVNVLQRKGLLSAQTMHSLMYDVHQDTETGEIRFSKKYRLADKVDLIIVDESSMLSTDLYRDIKSYGTKCLFVGDPGQLEPVGDNPDLMRQPDLTLSKIHRQAEKSPIITLASDIRLGQDIRRKIIDSSDLTVRMKTGLAIPDLIQMKVDQVICARNKTRIDVNKRYRRALSQPGNLLTTDSKIIVLRNNQQMGVFNGMLLFVDKILQDNFDHWSISAHDEVNRKFHKLNVWKRPFLEELPKEFTIPRHQKIPLVYCDWGYCITCHKSQGSEWDHVLVWDEWMPPTIWDMRRWRYTAITRAAKKLTYCL